jgi:hypothetical protein
VGEVLGAERVCDIVEVHTVVYLLSKPLHPDIMGYANVETSGMSQNSLQTSCQYNRAGLWRAVVHRSSLSAEPHNLAAQTKLLSVVLVQTL